MNSFRPAPIGRAARLLLEAALPGTSAEIAQRLGISRSTACRLLRAAIRAGRVSQGTRWLPRKPGARVTGHTYVYSIARA